MRYGSADMKPRTFGIVGLVALVSAAAVFFISGSDSAIDDSQAAPGSPTSDTASVLPTVEPTSIEAGKSRDFGPAPEVSSDPWSQETVDLVDQSLDSLFADISPTDQIAELGQTGDPRLAWVFADIIRFLGPGDSTEAFQAATQAVAPGIEIDPFSPWGSIVDTLIAWDIPVPPQYFDVKKDLYQRIEPKWAELFTEGTSIDWRHVGWGGVGIDDRELGSTEQCRCIPALDDPAVTSADKGDWYPDDSLIFGVVINDEARAYPKNMMEVHEMVNDTLGGRRIGMPYCTLCGSAQAYLTDEVPSEVTEEFGDPVFRTSGLLIRSNKMMFERNSFSFIDTFLGEATSGPLAEAGVTFPQVSVVTTSWGAWKQTHPDTTILAEDGGLGRTYDADPLGGRDDNGPIFPIGDVDPRLPVQEPVLGFVSASGTPIAVHAKAARSVLSDGDELKIEGVTIALDGDGIRAVGPDGSDIGGHQAFWFAWSQFHPDTKVWPLDY